MNKLTAAVISAVVAIILIATTATFIQDSTNSDDSELYVFVLSGQSNAQYFQEDVTVANELPSVPYGSIFYYGSSDQPAEYSDDWASLYSSYEVLPMNDSDGAYVIGSIEPGFASQFYLNTAHKCLVINVARGGASINDFLPGEYLYTYAHTLIEDALSKIDPEYSVVKSSLIWIQGEADRMMNPSEYKEKFEVIMEDYDALGFDTVLMSKVRSQWSPNISTAQQSLSIIPQVKLTNVADSFSYAKGTMANDGLHYSQEGRNILGQTLAGLSFVDPDDSKFTQPLTSIIPILIVAVIAALAAMMVVSRRD